MKKIKLLFFIAGLCAAYAAGAQPGEIVRQPQIEMNLSRSLWFNSSNAAGMSVIPLSQYSIVGLGYQMEKGDFKMSQQGEQTSTVGFNTSGSTNIGQTYLWGSFDYRNIVEENTLFLTNIYDPQRDMPYYVADNVGSQFKKQSYGLDVAVAFPKLWGFVTPGGMLGYNTSTGAKQRDPRAVTYYLTVNASPSFVFDLSAASTLGLSINYEYLYERSTFNRSDTEVDCPVYIMRGLGNYTAGVVSGSVGVGTFFYKGNRIGGGIQYGFNNGGDFSALVDAVYSYKVEDAFQTPTKKQNMGSTRQNLYNVQLQLLNDGSRYMKKLTIAYTEKKTDGIEYIQKLDTSFEVSEWITLAKYVRSRYAFKDLDLHFEFYSKEGNGYNWRAGIEGEWSNKYDEYLLPASSLEAENMMWNLYGKKNFQAGKKSTIVIGANVGFNHNIAGEYRYTGGYDESDTVQQMYANDILYLSSDYVKFGGEISFSTAVTQTAAVYVQAKCQYFTPEGESLGKRMFTDFSVGITF